MVFYRKYRPQTINELDSEQVRKTLTDVLSLPEIPHAFLFTGPKGLGKTSTARIVAKVVNCEASSRWQLASGKTKKTKASSDQPLASGQLEPCNACEQCISITNGTNLDILEIDAASNRGIDEMRELRDKIKLAPLSARKKVYIIDEVHMLTAEAFNALLKTLEEPPSHAMFILCTTESQKVPATIISRCFHVQFTPAGKEEIARSFKRIAEGEGLIIEDTAIEAIVQLAEGGFRDAHKILEELVSMVGLSTGKQEKTISLELVEKRFKVASSKTQVVKIVEGLQKKDIKLTLEVVEESVQQGIDIKLLTQQLFEVLHSLLLVKAGVTANSEGRVQNSELEIEELKVLLGLLSQATQDMKFALIPQLPLELALAEYIHRVKADMKQAKVQEKVTIQKTTEVVVANTQNNGVTVATMRKQLGNLARVKALYGEDKTTPVDEKIPEAIPPINLMQTSNTEITPEWLSNFWQAFISEMKVHNHTIAGVLRGCMIKQFDKKTLVIQTAYTFHKDRLDDAKTRTLLEETCKILTGNPVTVQVVLKQ